MSIILNMHCVLKSKASHHRHYYKFVSTHHFWDLFLFFFLDLLHRDQSNVSDIPIHVRPCGPHLDTKTWQHTNTASDTEHNELYEDSIPQKRIECLDFIFAANAVFYWILGNLSHLHRDLENTGCG